MLAALPLCPLDLRRMDRWIFWVQTWAGTEEPGEKASVWGAWADDGWGLVPSGAGPMERLPLARARAPFPRGRSGFGLEAAAAGTEPLIPFPWVFAIRVARGGCGLW